MLRPAIGMKAARRAAAGWGGQRLQLWRRGDAPCSAPCRGRDALFGTWRWDTAADARQFDEALPAFMEKQLGGKATGPGTWALQDGWAAVDQGPKQTTVAFAPSAALARQLGGSG
jgi:hypothetical protein